ncbi:MAG: hypothetical protein KAH57_04705 [Thermoplasmata archaeon]|nr:hypothetical protein [Thermoplasmata archaeon]
MFIGKRTILLIAAVGAVVSIRFFIVELFKWTLGWRVPDLILNICTVAVIGSMILLLIVLVAGAKKAEDTKAEKAQSKIRSCSSCGYRLNYLKGNGWYCEKCMKYEK